MPEVSVLYNRARELRTHDVAGWRRERVPEKPLGYPVRDRPDWVCEVAVSTFKKDVRDLRLALELEEIPFYWVVDTVHEQLLVFERIDGHLIQTRALFRDDGMQRIPPFDAMEFSVGALLGDDPE